MRIAINSITINHRCFPILVERRDLGLWLGLFKGVQAHRQSVIATCGLRLDPGSKLFGVIGLQSGILLRMADVDMVAFLRRQTPARSHHNQATIYDLTLIGLGGHCTIVLNLALARIGLMFLDSDALAVLTASNLTKRTTRLLPICSRIRSRDPMPPAPIWCTVLPYIAFHRFHDAVSLFLNPHKTGLLH